MALWNILAPILGPVLDRVIPDVNARAAAREAMEQAVNASDLELLKGQLEVNRVEAQHASLFVSGWRPFVGWVSGLGFLLILLIYILGPWLSALAGVPQPPPINEPVADLVIYVLLGLAGLRSFEGFRGYKRK